MHRIKKNQWNSKHQIIYREKYKKLNWNLKIILTQILKIPLLKFMKVKYIWWNWKVFSPLLSLRRLDLSISKHLLIFIKFQSRYIQVANIMNLMKMKSMNYKFNLILIHWNVNKKFMRISHLHLKQILNPHFNPF